MEFIYRSATNRDQITKRVVFSGLSSAGKPQGRTYNAAGHDLGVRELSTVEARKFRHRAPEEITFEMGVFEPYETVHEHARRLGAGRRFLAPPRRSGRGTRNAAVVEMVTGLMRSPLLRGVMGKGIF